MIFLKRLLFSTLMFLPVPALAAVCESIYDGDKIVSSAQGTPENYILNFINRSSSPEKVTHQQLQAVYNAKEKIQRVVGIYPKFLICGDAEPNAFAFEQQDGAVVGVSIGMVKLLNGDEDMAAAVIGHEIAHHTQNHRLRTKQSELMTNIIGSLIGLYIEARVQQRYKIAGVGRSVATIGSVLTISKFSRDHEREADEVGFRYMVDAGYNPEASIRLAETLLSNGSNGTGLFYDTHPSWGERASRFKTLIARNSRAQQIIAFKNSENIALTKSSLPAETNNKYESISSSFQLNDSQKSLNEGLVALIGGNTVEAVKLFKKSSLKGNVESQNILGIIYLLGRGVTKDEKEAVRFFRLAAEQGDARAQNSLGRMYEEGTGVIKNEKEALRLFQLSAEQGFVEAQYILGEYYLQGIGVAKDEKEAIKFFRLAAAQANVSAQNALGYMYIKGLGVAKNEKEAVKFFQIASDQGDAQGQGNLGVMYEEGLGVEKDEREAIRLYKLAANQGNEKAISRLKKLNVQLN
ncbi:Peptidase M48 [Methylophilaceae bacterium]